MDENNNGFTPYDDFTEEGYDAVTRAANELNAAGSEAIDSFVNDGADQAVAADENARPKQRNYERYLNEGKWQPAEPVKTSGYDSDIGGGFDNFENGSQGSGYIPAVGSGPDYTAASGIPEGLEEPVTMGEWLVTMLLMMIPCVNIVLMFVWAFGQSEKKSKSNFFKAELIVMGVLLALYIVVIVVAVLAGLAAAF